MRTFNKFREEALGNMSGTSDEPGYNNEVINAIIEILKKENIHRAFLSGQFDSETKADLRQVAGYVKNLKERPEPKKSGDPMSNVVTRPAAGSDTSGSLGSEGS